MTSLWNRLICLRTDLSASGEKERLKSSHCCKSVLYTSQFKNQEVAIDTSTLQKGHFETIIAHFFRHGVPPNAPRRVPQHDASFCPTRRELISARPRRFGKNDTKRALFRPFPECAIIDIMKAKAQERRQSAPAHNRRLSSNGTQRHRDTKKSLHGG